MSVPLPDPPVQLKAIQPYIRIASEIEKIDPIVAYWVRLFSTESALKIDKNSPECKTYLIELMNWLEDFKKKHKDNETVSNQTVGQAHMENLVLQIFNKADTQDREGAANKTTVRMFYMSSLLFEALEVFGPLTEEVSTKAKYAKYKAAYIQKCLKTGETPVPGPPGESQPNPPDSTSTPSKPTLPSDSQQPKVEPTRSTGSVLDIPEVPTDDPSGEPPEEPFIMKPSTGPVFPPPLPRTPLQPDPSTKPVSTPQYPTSPPKTTLDSSTSSSSRATSTVRIHAINGAPLNTKDLAQSQKYCKFANSSLMYDDVPGAVEFLEKALKLLKTGEHSD